MAGSGAESPPKAARARTAVTPLDERERRYVRLAALVAAVSAVALYAPQFDEPAAVVLALIGVAMAGFLALAGRRGGRLLTVVAAFALGFGPWGLAWLLGLPYMALAAWLAVRGSRAGETAARRARRRTGTDAADAASSPRARPERPRANKRYTPPQRRPR